MLVPGCLQPRRSSARRSPPPTAAPAAVPLHHHRRRSGREHHHRSGQHDGHPERRLRLRLLSEGFSSVINYTAISPQPDCDGGICLLVIDEKYQCETDLECQNLDPAAKCDEGLCDVSADVLLDETRCTQTCETVEDCPAIPGCMTGLICSVFLVSDELCCQKVCGCQDSLYVPGVMSLQMLCDEEPDFCG
ncbi:hypothetical protein [Nannocystis pusilla]|uniref:hypothetical protein n=1 Tax=Nannocystis pusilla TaxID=889268 RepID=UPI003B78C5A5